MLVQLVALQNGKEGGKEDELQALAVFVRESIEVVIEAVGTKGDGGGVSCYARQSGLSQRVPGSHLYQTAFLDWLVAAHSG